MFPNGRSTTPGHYVGVHLKCVDAKSLGNHKKVNEECVFCFRNGHRPREHHSMTGTISASNVIVLFRTICICAVLASYLAF